MKIYQLCFMGALVSSFTIANAQDLEEFVKGIEVGGFLRYRLTDTRVENYDFTNGLNGTGSTYASSYGQGAGQQWRINADFTTPEVQGFSATLGTQYWKTYVANSGDVLGNGLGAGKDGDFGVNTYYLKYHIPHTQSFIRAGKSRIDTPVHDPLDDRIHGVWFESHDAPGVVLHAGLSDTFSLDDGAMALPFAAGQDSISKNYYQLGAKVDLQGFNAQALYLGVQDFINYLFYLSAGYEHPNFHVKGEYAFSQLQGAGFQALIPNIEIEENHALYTLEAGVRLSLLGVRVGYIGSGNDGYAVALDNQGGFQMAGWIWNEYSITGIGYSPFGNLPTQSERLHAAYGSVSLHFLEKDALKLAVDYVKGGRKIEAANEILDFVEIAPYIGWQYNEKLHFYVYYAMLSAKKTPKLPAGMTLEDLWYGDYSYDNNAPRYADAKQNRLRVQVRYNF